MRSYHVIPEILELLRRRGPLRTSVVKDRMVKVISHKGLVYSDEAVSRALTILKWRKLAINAKLGVWSITAAGAVHKRISTDQARRFTSERATQSKIRRQRP